MHRGCNTIFLVQNKSLIEKLNLFSQNWSIEPKIIIFEKDTIYKNLISRYKINAIVTGNYLSDGPNDIFKIKEMKEKTNLPILSPLISMTKKEIKSKIEEMLN
jgi:adenylyl- and sulfurtransferase ThiI